MVPVQRRLAATSLCELTSHKSKRGDGRLFISQGNIMLETRLAT